jgi:hypothetical protein
MTPVSASESPTATMRRVIDSKKKRRSILHGGPVL